MPTYVHFGHWGREITLEASRELTPEKLEAVNADLILAAQRNLEQKREAIRAQKPGNGGAPKSSISGVKSIGEILAPSIANAKAHEAAKVKNQEPEKETAAAGGKVSREHFPWFPMEMSDFTRTEWITATPAARALIISFKAAYWLNECRGLPSQPVAMARHIGLHWSLIKSNLKALMACHEIVLDESGGESILRDKSLDDKWQHAIEVSNERRKAAKKRHANAPAIA